MNVLKCWFLVVASTVFSGIFSVDAQNFGSVNSGPSFAKQGSHWLNLNLGLSFMNPNAANFDDPFLMTGENRRNFGIIAQPKFQVFIKDRLGVGFHLGTAFEEFENEEISFKQNKNNYFVGVQGEYYFLNLNDFFLMSSELDLGYHWMQQKVNTAASEINTSSSNYLKAGLSVNLNFILHDDWVLYAMFFDVLSYTSSENNFFDYSKGLQLNNSLENFVNFPQFGVLWKLF